MSALNRMSSTNRPRPLQVVIPSSLLPQSPPAQADHTIPFPSYSIEVTPPPYTEYDENPTFSPQRDDHQNTPRPRAHSMESSSPTFGPSMSAGARTNASFMAFPEPQIYRSASYTSVPHHTRTRSHSQIGASPPFGIHPQQSTASFASTASSYIQDNDSDQYGSGSEDHSHDAEDLSRELSILSLNSDESLRRFQAGELPENDQAWHRLVPLEARNALGKQEVQRQSVLFEVFKAEREYVSDLETVEEARCSTLSTFLDFLTSS
ncbi:hypothetical protein D9615_004364 [Tricholomella constricta]|uniref:DH domain-containing protein n=1 Tax=Tricholomella constricta TaxID=117010 RepID=A0A8H5M634_9AGAR|nr:hypothetical protein D9615_004364 [Tricholomella constricta]